MNTRNDLTQRFINRLFLHKDVNFSVRSQVNPLNTTDEYLEITFTKPVHYSKMISVDVVCLNPEVEADVLVYQAKNFEFERNSSLKTKQSVRDQQYSKVANEAFEIFQKKNHDYGDAFAKFGPVGVLVRLEDKIQRFVSVSSKDVSLVNDEMLRDTLMDLKNYATMAIMLLDEKENQ